MTPEQRRARAYAAQALMNDATLKLGWDEIENDIRAQWEASWLPRKRDRLWAHLRHLQSLRRKLASFAAQGRE